MEECNHESGDSITITNYGSHVTIKFNNLRMEGEKIEDMILDVGESAVINLNSLEQSNAPVKKEKLNFNEHDFSEETRDALK